MARFVVPVLLKASMVIEAETKLAALTEVYCLRGTKLHAGPVEGNIVQFLSLDDVGDERFAVLPDMQIDGIVKTGNVKEVK